MKRPHHRPLYSWFDVLMASDTEPMDEARRQHQLTCMWTGLAALETAPEPTTNDWRVCSDAVNLLETLVTQGYVQDSSGLLMDAITALAMAGKRYRQGHALRLDGPGIAAVRAVLVDYSEILATLPHRAMVQCHIATERRIHAIHSGRKQPHDVEVIDL